MALGSLPLALFGSLAAGLVGPQGPTAELPARRPIFLLNLPVAAVEKAIGEKGVAKFT
jgi:hypothetical protein